MQISDILSVESADTFTRPIYACNAIATVPSSDSEKVITVRDTAFAKAEETGGSAAIEAMSGNITVMEQLPAKPHPSMDRRERDHVVTQSVTPR